MADSTNSAADDLKESQAKLDGIQEQIIANKQARMDLRTEAVELRNAYIKEEKNREDLLRQVLAPAPVETEAEAEVEETN